MVIPSFPQLASGNPSKIFSRKNKCIEINPRALFGPFIALNLIQFLLFCALSDFGIDEHYSTLRQLILRAVCGFSYNTDNRNPASHVCAIFLIRGSKDFFEMRFLVK